MDLDRLQGVLPAKPHQSSTTGRMNAFKVRFLNELPEAFDLMVCMPTLNKLSPSSAETLQDCCEKLKGGLNISKSSEQHELSVQTKRLLFFLFQREPLYVFFLLVKFSVHQSVGFLKCSF